MIDPHHIWNLIYNAESNKHQPATSPNTALATQNESHDWSASPMKRHLQCGEQQASTSNLTKYCACHAKWISWLIRITYETSFTMRGATSINLQPHQRLRLPRKMNLMIDPHHIWNVIYNAQSKSHPPPTPPNSAPATQNESDDWSASHMKRHLQCAEQQASPSNLTKYCASHAKWISWLIRIAYATSFTMRGATGITLQPHQVLRLPRKMNLMIDPHHIWNVIYNASSNRHHPPTAPNTAHATQNECHDWSCSPMKRHFQCAEQQESPSHFTEYCACHTIWTSWLIPLTYENVIYNARSKRYQPATSPNTAPATQNCISLILEKFTENSWSGISNARPIRAWSENDPTMIRPWKRKNWTRRAAKATFRTRQEQILLKITTFPAPAIIPNFTTCCACHEKWHMNFTKCCACHEKWHMNFTKCCACHAKWISWLIHITYDTSFTMRGATGITFQPHQILRLPRKICIP